MYTDHTVAFYDAWVPGYFQEWKDNALLLPLLQSLMGRLPPEPGILDLGCGPGCESKRLSDLGANVVGVDLSKASLEIARQHAPRVTFLEMDIAHLELPCDSFDAVLDAAALFHFTDDEQDAILRSIADTLKAGGVLLSIYPTGEYCGLQERTIDGRVYRRHVNLKNMAAWADMVRARGFTLLEAPAALRGPFWAAWFGVQK